MAKVITLEGLEAQNVERPFGKCTDTVTVYSPTLEREVEVCRADITKAVIEQNIAIKRRRGRPKGTTVSRGAKRPSVKTCSSPRWVTKGKRSFCRCSDRGNAQMLPNKACGRDTRKK